MRPVSRSRSPGHTSRQNQSGPCLETPEHEHLAGSEEGRRVEDAPGGEHSGGVPFPARRIVELGSGEGVWHFPGAADDQDLACREQRGGVLCSPLEKFSGRGPLTHIGVIELGALRDSFEPVESACRQDLTRREQRQGEVLAWSVHRTRRRPRARRRVVELGGCELASLDGASCDQHLSRGKERRRMLPARSGHVPRADP
jgi:hypothetical protein